MNDVVCLRSYFDPEEAYVVRSALQAADINVILSNDPTLATMPYLRVAVGGYRLSVPASQEGRAREALADIETYQTDEPIGADAPCVRCGGRNFRRERSWRWAAIALFYKVGLAAQSGRSRCLSCGEIVDCDDRPFAVRVFFFLFSIVILCWIAWGWSDWMLFGFAI